MQLVHESMLTFHDSIIKPQKLWHGSAVDVTLLMYESRMNFLPVKSNMILRNNFKQ